LRFTSSSIMKKYPSSTTSSLSSPLYPSDDKTDTTTTPSLQQRRKSVRSVRFLDAVSVKRTISRHYMTQQEKSNCWLQEYEFLMIKKRNNMVIEQIRQKRITQKNDSNTGPHHSNSNNNNISINNSHNTYESSLCFRGL
jgi:hypothetical protein